MKKLAIHIVLIILIINILFLFFPQDNLTNIYMINNINSIELIHKYYYLSLISFLVANIILLLACLPCSGILRIIAGFIFGIYGFFISLLASVVAAYFMYVFSYNKESKHNIERIEKKLMKRPYLYVFLFRIFPIFPAWLVNITAGTLKLNLNKFLFISCIGFIPSVAFLTYIGINSSEYIMVINSIQSNPTINIVIALFILILFKIRKKK
jgi:uncharacterized membrane protein YdjX (TVP38/TMEM64 family)